MKHQKSLWAFDRVCKWSWCLKTNSYAYQSQSCDSESKPFQYMTSCKFTADFFCGSKNEKKNRFGWLKSSGGSTPCQLEKQLPSCKWNFGQCGKNSWYSQRCVVLSTIQPKENSTCRTALRELWKTWSAQQDARKHSCDKTWPCMETRYKWWHGKLFWFWRHVAQYPPRP